MGIEFILDRNLTRAQKDLDGAIKVLSKKEDKNAVFLRRFWFACLKAVEKDVHKEVLKKRIAFVAKVQEKRRMLPPPPKPVTRMVMVEEGDIV